MQRPPSQSRRNVKPVFGTPTSLMSVGMGVASVSPTVVGVLNARLYVRRSDWLRAGCSTNAARGDSMGSSSRL